MGMDMAAWVRALLPELVLLVGAMAALLGGSFLPRTQQWKARLVAVAAILGSSAVTAADLTAAPAGAFDGSYAVDRGTGIARLVVLTATLLVVLLGTDEVADHRQESETYALLLLSALGAMVLAGADDLLVLAVAYLLASIPLYALVGQERTPRAAEAALKTYLLGALLGIALLLGVTLLYAVSGSTRYADLTGRLPTSSSAVVAVGVVGVLGGLLFKAGGVPAHSWVPDAAQGAGVTAAAFLTTVPKIGALVAAYRLVEVVPGIVDVRLLIGVLAAASMTLGNLAAYAQSDPRRLLGWSTVSQVGYLLVAVAVAGRSDLSLPSLLLYLAAYAVTNLGAFAVVAALPERRDLATYRGLAGTRPWLAAALLVCLLGLVGTPPTAVFVGKLTIATAAWDGGAAWLSVVLVVNTMASLFYYLRWLAPVYRTGEPAETWQTFTPRPWAESAAVVAAVASVVLGLASGAAWGLVDGPLVR